MPAPAAAAVATAPSWRNRSVRRVVPAVAAAFGLVLAAGADELPVDGVACTLGDAIEAANADATVGGCVHDGSPGHDTVILQDDVVLAVADTLRSSLREGAFAGLPEVTSAMTIRAAEGRLAITRESSLGCDVADGPDEFRLLQVVGTGNLTLRDLTFSGGCADRGGAILVADAASLALDDVELTSNTARAAANAAGGAIWARSTGTFAIASSLFESNLAEGPDAAGGALWDDGALLTLRDTRFRENRAHSTAGEALGGAAYLEGAPALERVVFRANVASGADGTGVNGLDASGGALFLWGDGATVSDSLFAANVARGGNSDRRGGAAEGGALETESDGSSLHRVVFVDNLARGGDGGSMSGGSARAGAVEGYNLLYAEAVTFSGNVARGGDSVAASGGSARAGALSASTADPLLVLERATFHGNRAIAGSGGAGSGIAVAGGLSAFDDVTVSGSVFEANSTTADGTTEPSPCVSDVSVLDVTSLGFNTVDSASPQCDFSAMGDQTEAGPSLLPLGEHGCATVLPDGSCLPSHPVDLLGAALDQGSCGGASDVVDGRGFSRPIDFAATDADDGCDAGAYEARDEDGGGDGIEDGVDNCPADPNPGQEDGDADGVGDVCDACDGDDATGDADADGICADRDCDDGDGLGVSCWLFGDGFESGDLGSWTVPGR